MDDEEKREATVAVLRRAGAKEEEEAPKYREEAEVEATECRVLQYDSAK